MPEREFPKPQRRFTDIEMSRASDYARALNRRLPDIEIEGVQTVLDLYCGNGMLTLGSIALFKHAIIHAVDVHDVLVPDAISHPRVVFHKGWVTDMLESGALPVSDIVLMSFANSYHGFTAENISLLSAHVGGVLLTIGDNANIEKQPWFLDSFRCVADIPNHLAANWVSR